LLNSITPSQQTTLKTLLLTLTALGGYKAYLSCRHWWNGISVESERRARELLVAAEFIVNQEGEMFEDVPMGDLFPGEVDPNEVVFQAIENHIDRLQDEEPEDALVGLPEQLEGPIIQIPDDEPAVEGIVVFPEGGHPPIVFGGGIVALPPILGNVIPPIPQGNEPEVVVAAVAAAAAPAPALPAWGAVVRPDGNLRARPARRSLFVGHMIRQVKYKFGMLKRLESNRLMVRKYVLDLCEDRGVRRSHVAGLIDDIVELSFVPSKDDIRRAEMRAATCVVDAEESYYHRYVAPFQRWFSFWNRPFDRVDFQGA
jgi:hypothetical protein